MRVLIIADDLTGALDSAVTLTGAGLRCVVARRPGDVPAALAERPDVLSVSTASREGGAAAARAAVAAALDAVGALPEIVFKKVDSRLKGHVAAEVAVLAARGGRGARSGRPGDPGAGPDRRRTAGLTGAGVAAPIDVAAAVAGSGLDARGSGHAHRRRLRRRAGGARWTGPPALLVGAAGLAAAVARRLRAGRLVDPGAAAARRRSCSRSARAIRSPSPRSTAGGAGRVTGHGGARTASARWRRAGRSSCGWWRPRGGRSTRARRGRGSRTGLRNLSGRAASGRCSAAAARRRTRSSARSGRAF